MYTPCLNISLHTPRFFPLPYPLLALSLPAHLLPHSSPPFASPRVFLATFLPHFLLPRPSCCLNQPHPAAYTFPPSFCLTSSFLPHFCSLCYSTYSLILIQSASSDFPPVSPCCPMLSSSSLTVSSFCLTLTSTCFTQYRPSSSLCL
ncbi:hypothetical protein Pcinc_041669 [Petrolisthes cinctipes]|uniref:Uncharacterized protein n=1 Tax=Petrolisthes cinctipes TaxID=88211 RepID=A0AAE1EGP6_PETCI|nr:hypothetical protein Pcinc_041669 [Petrolisthes cinctipes]